MAASASSAEELKLPILARGDYRDILHLEQVLSFARPFSAPTQAWLVDYFTQAKLAVPKGLR